MSSEDGPYTVGNAQNIDYPFRKCLPIFALNIIVLVVFETSICVFKYYKLLILLYIILILYVNILL